MGGTQRRSRLNLVMATIRMGRRFVLVMGFEEYTMKEHGGLIGRSRLTLRNSQVCLGRMFPIPNFQPHEHALMSMWDVCGHSCQRGEFAGRQIRV